MQIKIEKNIPIPVKRGGDKNQELVAALQSMEPGDSFFTPLACDPTDLRLVQNQRMRLQSVCKKLNLSVTIRKTSEGYRLWLLDPKS